MDRFKTITPLELMYNAYYNMLDKWYIETRRNEDFARSHNGKNSPLSIARLNVLEPQLDELHEAIIQEERYMNLD